MLCCSLYLEATSDVSYSAVSMRSTIPPSLVPVFFTVLTLLFNGHTKSVNPLSVGAVFFAENVNKKADR
jgi:hypothetical protein